MSVRQYIGARYVPKFYEFNNGVWQSNTEYEPLTIVQYNNNSYTSKKTVPANIGNPSENPTYWVNTGNYNAQIIDIDNRKMNKIDNIVYVKDFGAVGDGITDDTQAIQDAIDSKNGNVCVVFDPKTYLIKHPIKIYNSYTKLTGYIEHQRQVGQGGTILADYTNGDIISIGDGTNFIENVEINSLRVTRTSFGDSTSKGIHVYDNSLMTSCLNCGASGSRYGFYMGEGASGFRINHCHLTPHLADGSAITTNFDVAGIFFEGGTTGGSGLFVDDVIFYGNSNDTAVTTAIKAESTGQFGDMWINMVQCAGRISKVIHLNSGSGFNHDVNITNITADNVVSDGIMLQASVTDYSNINISKVWFLLFDSANGINIQKYGGVNINQIMLNGNNLYNGNYLYFNHVDMMNVSDVIIKGTSCLRTGQLEYSSNVTIKGLVAETGTNSHFYTANNTGNCIFTECILNDSDIIVTDNVTVLNSITKNINNANSVQMSPPYVNSSQGATVNFKGFVNGEQDNAKLDWAVCGGHGANTSIQNGVLTIDSSESAGNLFIIATDKISHNTSAISIVNIY